VISVHDHFVRPSKKDGVTMSIAIRKKSKNLLLVHITGILKYSDREHFEMVGRLGIDRDRKIKILVNATHFSGWGEGGDWGNQEFMYEYDPCIEKIAVIADEKWEEQMLLYLEAGRRQASVAFFSPSEAQNAQDWLQIENA
jgi:hypothetical protein